MTIKRCYPVLVGASVAENQLCNSESVTVPNGRKYYLKKSGTESLGASTGTAITGLTSGSDMVIDLTQLLGTAIADYVYSLETATAGSGIAWLRSYGFLGGYVPYNSGSLESVEVTEKVVTGKNQCSGMLYDGKVPSIASGALVSYHGIRSDFIHVIPNTVYTATFPYSVLNAFVEYDASKTFLKATLNANTFTTAPNTAYVMLRSDLPSGTDEAKDCMFELGSTTTEYEPYKSTSYPLGSDVLRGIFKLDANNQLYADGDRKTSDGTITRRYGALTATELIANYNFFNADKHMYASYLHGSLNAVINKTPCNAICNVMNVDATWAQMQAFDGTTVIGGLYHSSAWDYTRVYLCLPSTVTTREQAETWLTSNNIKIVYELATPTTEQSTPFPSPQVCYPDGTEEYVTNNGVPVGHETKYQL